MDNREFARLLLCEATELLEGAQAEAYKARKADEEFEKWENGKGRRMHQNYSNSGNSKVYNAATDRGFASYDSNKKRSITKAEENGLDEKSALAHQRKMQNIAQRAANITEREANRRDANAKKSGKVYDKKFDDNYQIAMDAANRHVRRHGKRLNESIAILLTEAALLLNDED